MRNLLRLPNKLHKKTRSRRGSTKKQRINKYTPSKTTQNSGTNGTDSDLKSDAINQAIVKMKDSTWETQSEGINAITKLVKKNPAGIKKKMWSNYTPCSQTNNKSSI